MDVEILPEPDPESRRALLAALDTPEPVQEPPAYRSPWRRAALEPENDD